MQPSSPKLFPSLWRITNKLNSSPGSRVHFQSLADFIALFFALTEALGESVYYFFLILNVGIFHLLLLNSRNGMMSFQCQSAVCSGVEDDSAF